MKLENIKKIYIRDNKEKISAINNISYTFKKGIFYAIMGESGSGKTTLINILGLIDNPTGGKYYLDGKEISLLSEDALSEMRNKKIGFVFQHYYLNNRLLH